MTRRIHRVGLTITVVFMPCSQPVIISAGQVLSLVDGSQYQDTHDGSPYCASLSTISTHIRQVNDLNFMDSPQLKHLRLEYIPEYSWRIRTGVFEYPDLMEPSPISTRSRELTAAFTRIEFMYYECAARQRMRPDDSYPRMKTDSALRSTKPTNWASCICRSSGPPVLASCIQTRV
jgi:hypothetical protein